jgi:hypothetical protein
MDNKELEKLDRFASLMDSRFRIPFTNMRFGIDSVAGLVPGLGDAANLAASGYVLHRAMKLGARKRVIVHMAANSLVDFTVGSVPLAGDLFDLFFKANLRNVALLKKELERQERRETTGAAMERQT